MILKVGVVTVGRSDYGIYFPVLRLLQADQAIELQLIVSAAHLEPKFGNTVQEIEQDGFPIAARVPIKKDGDSREDVARAIGTGVQKFTACYAQLRPDILLLLGDRYEMMAAAMAALPCRIPVAHMHGGELTLGAIDDAMRHAITKLSHVHFAATTEYAGRIRQMGEEPWRVHVTGSPVIDSIRSTPAIPRAELEKEIGLDLSRTLLVTYHPTTLEDDSSRELDALLFALAESGHSLLFTYPNADSHSDVIVQRIEKFVAGRQDARLVANLGHRKYHGVQRYVAAMVGNSSSGIIEAASFHLPVVNVGTRQQGRTHGKNVIDVNGTQKEISPAIATAVSTRFRQSIANIENPYGDGRAAERIVSILKSVELGPRLVMKKFVDYACIENKSA